MEPDSVLDEVSERYQIASLGVTPDPSFTGGGGKFAGVQEVCSVRDVMRLHICVALSTGFTGTYRCVL